MASSTGYLPVDPPRAAEPRVSLLATARTLGRVIGTVPVNSAEPLPEEGQADDLRGGQRWVNGVTFRPTYCGTGGAVVAPCVAADVDLGTRPSNVENQPLLAEVYTDCSSLGELDREEAEAAAVTLLNVAQHGIIANEFWTGATAHARSLPNQSLAIGATVLGSANEKAWDALMLLEDALAGVGDDACGGGVRSMIHATPATVTVWMGLGLVRAEGGLLLTALDTVVVTGPGYDGSYDSSGTNTAGTYAYGTGMVDVRLGAARDLRYIERADNTIEVHAFRPFSVVWDGCCHLGVDVDLAART